MVNHPNRKPKYRLFVQHVAQLTPYDASADDEASARASVVLNALIAQARELCPERAGTDDGDRQ